MQIANLDESDSENERVQPEPQSKRARTIKTTGTWILLLVVVSNVGSVSLRPPADAFDTSLARSLANRCVLGVICTRWEFVENIAEPYSWLRKAAAGKTRAAQLISGYLQYPVAKFAKLVQPIPFQSLVQSLDDIQ